MDYNGLNGGTPMFDIMTLTAADRCSRCGAQAFVRTVHGSTQHPLYLEWCAHDYHAHEAKLAPAVVADRLSTLQDPPKEVAKA